MAKPLTPTQTDAVQFLYGGGGDETIECWSAGWVVTRYPHECFSVYHDQTKYRAGRTTIIPQRARA